MSDVRLDAWGGKPGPNAAQVSPEDRARLRGILKHYAKEPHPFRACVRDNTKRFGEERAKRICAVVKDLIRGTTRWRGKNNPNDKGSAGLSEDACVLVDIPDDLCEILAALSDEQVAQLTHDLWQADDR